MSDVMKLILIRFVVVIILGVIFLSILHHFNVERDYKHVLQRNIELKSENSTLKQQVLKLQSDILIDKQTEKQE